MNWLRQWLLRGLAADPREDLIRLSLQTSGNELRAAQEALRAAREDIARRELQMRAADPARQELLALLARFEALCELLGVELVAPPGGTDAAVVAVSLDGRRQAIQALQASMELDEIRRIKAKCLDRLRILERDIAKRLEAP